MAKATTTRREAPRAATSEEIAEENRRAEEARALTQAPATALLAHDKVVDHIAAQGWKPRNTPELLFVVIPLAILLNNVLDGVNAIERRLALLEARMTTSPEWAPEPGNKAEEGLLEPLRLGDGEVDWSPDEEPTGDALHDLDTGALRPQTWPQLLSCLRSLANQVDFLVNDHIDAEVDRDGVLRAVALLIESAGIHRSAGVR